MAKHQPTGHAERIQMGSGRTDRRGQQRQVERRRRHPRTEVLKLGQRRHDPCRQATRLGCDRSDRERESQDVDDAATITANHAQVIQQSTIGVTFHYEDLAITLGDAISLTDASGTWTFKDGAFVKQEPEPMNKEPIVARYEIEKYRTIEATLGLANDYAPPIRLNAGDLDGRVLKFNITDGGNDVDDLNGLSARLTWNRTPQTRTAAADSPT